MNRELYKCVVVKTKGSFRLIYPKNASKFKEFLSIIGSPISNGNPLLQFVAEVSRTLGSLEKELSSSASLDDLKIKIDKSCLDYDVSKITMVPKFRFYRFEDLGEGHPRYHSISYRL